MIHRHSKAVHLLFDILYDTTAKSSPAHSGLRQIPAPWVSFSNTQNASLNHRSYYHKLDISL